MSEEYMTFNLEEFKSLKEAHQEAVDTDKESFIFQGHELLTSYAKYLVEHLENVYGGS